MLRILNKSSPLSNLIKKENNKTVWGEEHLSMKEKYFNTLKNCLTSYYDDKHVIHLMHPS